MMPHRPPMVCDPPSLKQITELYGDPLAKVVEIHEKSVAALATAEAEGNKREAAQLRRLVKRSQKLIDDYGLKS